MKCELVIYFILFYIYVFSDNEKTYFYVVCVGQVI